MKAKNLLEVLRDYALIVVLSILCAIVLWISAMRVIAPSYEKSYRDIPVEIVSGVSPTTTVDAVFSATKEDLHRYREEGIVARVDLSSLESGSYEIPLRFYVGGEEIYPKTGVQIRVTVLH